MHRTILALGLALLAGCSLAMKTDDLEPLVDAQGFCSAYWTRVAGYFESCQGAHAAFGEYFFDQQAPECEAWARSQDAGRIRYDKASAQACLDSFQRAGCNITGADLEPCEAAVRGVVGPNGACGSSFDCDPDATAGCTFAGATCPGTCQPLAGLNASCASTRCEPGLVCSAASVCVAAPTAGLACESSQCAEGLYCDSTNVCQPRGRSGAACTTYVYRECDEEFFCDGTRTPTTCQPYPESTVQTAVGGRCDGPYNCAFGLWCDSTTPTPTCQAQQVNVSCATTSAICRVPQICVFPYGGGTAMCQDPKQEGQACTGGEGACQPGLTCNAVNGAAGTCVLPGAIGDVCVTGGEIRLCGTGWCDRFGTGECNDYLALGATCYFDAQCSPSGVTAICRDDGSGPECVASCM